MSADATFAVNLDDNISGGAASAGKSLTDLRREILDGEQSLRAMQAAMRTLKSGTSINIDAFRSLRAQMTAQRTAVVQAQTSYVNLGGTFDKLKPKVAGTADALKNVEPPAQALSTSFGLSDLSAKGLVKGLALAGTALAAVAVAAVYAGARFAMFALQAADAGRSQRILLEAMVGSESAAKALGSTIAKVSANTTLSRDEISGYAQQLIKAKLSGEQLGRALEAVSAAASVGADAGAIVSELGAAAKSGKQLEGIIDRTNARFGVLARKNALSFTSQLSKAKANLAGIFSGVNLEPFLEGLKEILDLFDETSSTGQALRTLAETMLNPLIGGAGSAGTALKNAFREGVIAALKLAIVALTVKNNLKESFSVDTKMLKAALLGVGAALTFIGILAGIVVAGFVALGTLIVAPFAIAIAIITAAGVALYYVITAARQLATAIGGAVTSAVATAKSKISEFIGIGTNFVTSLAAGITGGISKVIAAAVGVASAAVGAVKKGLGIASPSKPMLEFGHNTSESLAMGQEEGIAAVEDASDDVAAAVLPNLGGAGTGGGVSGAGAGAGGTWVVHIHGVENAEQLTDPAFQSKLAACFESAALVMGASEAA